MFHIEAGQQTIQSAVDIALENDTILLAPGIYAGDGNRDVTLGNKNLVISSEPGMGPVIIDCGGTSASPHRAFLFDGGQDSTTVIAGLFIRSGYGRSDNLLGASVGGAILCINGSSPTIRACTFSGNRSGFGGTAIFLSGNSSPRIEDCLFTGNEGVRGAVTANASSPAIIECEFRQNIGERGAAIYLTSQASPRIENCLFIDNESINGGAIMFGNSSPTMTRCLFWKNSSSVAGGTIWSGGTSVSTITNCTIVSSSSPSGAAIYADGSSVVTVANSSITMSLGSGVIECNAGGSVNLSCSNIAENSNGDWIGCVADQSDLDGNLSVDPLFCDVSGGFLWPLAASPLAAANNSCAVLIGALDVGPEDCPCCAGFTGNTDCDPVGAVDIADLTALIDHLFISFDLLCCRASGNIDGDDTGLVDIADLTVLIDHLFLNFPETAMCQ